MIGEQYYDFAFSRAGFRAEIAPARTFGFLNELEALNKMDLAKGASLANTLALDETGVVNRERQRFADEFVRHKILDAIGDMALAGAPLIARFEGSKSGHATNNALLRALFADPANYERGGQLPEPRRAVTNGHFPEAAPALYIKATSAEPGRTST